MSERCLERWSDDGRQCRLMVVGHHESHGYLIHVAETVAWLTMPQPFAPNTCGIRDYDRLYSCARAADHSGEHESADGMTKWAREATGMPAPPAGMTQCCHAPFGTHAEHCPGTNGKRKAR